MQNCCRQFAGRVVNSQTVRFPQDSQLTVTALSFLYPAKLLIGGDNHVDKFKEYMELLERHYGGMFDTLSLFVEAA